MVQRRAREPVTSHVVNLNTREDAQVADIAKHLRAVVVKQLPTPEAALVAESARHLHVALVEGLQTRLSRHCAADLRCRWRKHVPLRQSTVRATPTYFLQRLAAPPTAGLVQRAELLPTRPSGPRAWLQTPRGVAT